MNLNDIKVGIEIEVEKVRNIKDHKSWEAVPEGMLVGGVEYVLKKATPLNKALTATKELYEMFDTEVFTQRCGIHVHVDIQPMSRVQLFNFITMYTMLEPLILDSLLPQDRVGNNFCLPISDAVDIEQALVDCATKRKDLRDLNLQHYKYGAMNLASIGRLGSLEFRALHGAEDVNELLYWTEMLATLALSAYGKYTPPELIVMMSEMTPRTFVQKFLPHNDKIMDNEEFDFLVYEGIRNAQRFAFLGEWDE